MPQFPVVIQLSSLNGTNGFQINGEAAGDYSGHWVSTAGDVNGDGFDDLIVGAVGADPNGITNSGASYVVFGKASGFTPALDLAALNGTTGFRLNGEAAHDNSGFAVSAAGDVNDDGFDDVIVGALFADPNGFDTGASYVVFGKASGFAADLDLDSLSGENGFRISGEGVVDNSGRAVASAGDVNGDGISDVIVGALAHTVDGVFRTGASYVVFGKTSGFTANLQLSSLDGTNGFKITGEVADDSGITYFGAEVHSAGDFNGDGYGDIIASAPAADPNGYSSGASYLVFGKASGFLANLELSTLDGTTGFQINGEAAGDSSGNPGDTSTGDINGDGLADLIIGAPGADANGSDSGAVYVIFGKASGFAANLELSALNGTNGFQISGESALDMSGVSSAGDVNGDGFDDVIVGAEGADPHGSGSGASYVVFGKASGFAANINLSSLNGTNGFQINGETANDISGGRVSVAGDVNSDGFDDILIGAPGADGGAGKSYVIFGHKPLIAVDRVGTGIANRINGGDRNDTLSGLAGDDTLIGHARRDQILGGTGNDTVTGGTGNDTVEGGAGSDDLDGGDDEDWLSYASSNAAVVVNLNTGAASGGHAAGDSMLAFENVIGSSFDDTLTGSTIRNRLDGGAGADTLSGLDGHDVLIGGAGGDRLNGGADRDVASYATAGAAVAIDLADLGANSGNATGDTYISIELFRLSGFGDVFSGNGQNQRVFGAAGDDTITGGGGADRIKGGLGADVFVYNAIAESQVQTCDRLYGFEAAGLDRIDLSAIDAIPGGIDDAFSFIGSATFTGTGQVRAYEHNGNTFVDVNTAGNNAPDMRIALAGIITLDQTDFVL